MDKRVAHPRFNGLIRYAYDVMEVYLSFFLLVTAYAAPNPVLYRLDFYACLAGILLLAYRAAIAPNPLAYTLRNFWELVSLVPLATAHGELLPLVKALRLTRLILLVVYGSDLARMIHRFIRGIALSPIFILFAATIVMGSLAYYAVEYGHSVHSYIDALWFTLVTITTVGYGDIVPRTLAGRALTMALMVIGIALWSTTVALLASATARSVTRAIARELQRIERRGASEEPIPVAVTGYGEDVVSTCMLAALTLPPKEFKRFIEELEKQYWLIHRSAE